MKKIDKLAMATNQYVTQYGIHEADNATSQFSLPFHPNKLLELKHQRSSSSYFHGDDSHS